MRVLRRLGDEARASLRCRGYDSSRVKGIGFTPLQPSSTNHSDRVKENLRIIGYGYTA